MTNLNSTTFNNFSSSQDLEAIYISKSLRNYVKSRLYAMEMNNIITEEDVINYVLMELIKARNCGKIINYPLAWTKVVSERYIRYTRKKYNSIQSLDEHSFLLERIPSYYEEKFIGREEKEEIDQKIQLLKSASQRIIKWRFFENMSWGQIAELLSKEEGQEINTSTARKRGERALIELRNLYFYGTNNLLTEQEISTSLTVKNHQQSTEESDLIKEIRQKIHQLNPAEQKLLTWHFIDNLPWSQVAELLSKEEGNTISTAAVRKRGERIMRKLKEMHIEDT
ncbi:hypothetical protein RIVM261_075400 [Rivularia sp. IAM M-261]|nr:hypothetical protein RIVM261_075400 [Rivularia sp. IAM M-261]